jgi:hypothetical protein
VEKPPAPKVANTESETADDETPETSIYDGIKSALQSIQLGGLSNGEEDISIESEEKKEIEEIQLNTEDRVFADLLIKYYKIHYHQNKETVTGPRNLVVSKLVESRTPTSSNTFTQLWIDKSQKVDNSISLDSCTNTITVKGNPAHVLDNIGHEMIPGTDYKNECIYKDSTGIKNEPNFDLYGAADLDANFYVYLSTANWHKGHVYWDYPESGYHEGVIQHIISRNLDIVLHKPPAYEEGRGYKVNLKELYYTAISSLQMSLKKQTAVGNLLDLGVMFYPHKSEGNSSLPSDAFGHVTFEVGYTPLPSC